MSVVSCCAQKYHLKLEGISSTETQILDSLNYNKTHPTELSLQQEKTHTQLLLSKKGYLENKEVSSKQTNDSSFLSIISLGKKTKTIRLLLKSNSAVKKLISNDKDSITILYPLIEIFLTEQKTKLENAGFVLSIFKLSNLSKKEDILLGDLEITENDQKIIDKIQVVESNNQQTTFPIGHLKQINKQFKNTIVSQNNLNKISEQFSKYNFAQQIKSPETLFTTDSTKVYVYLEKQNANSFDGFIGFNNNESQKVRLSGYLDLQLQNILNTGEEFKLNWKSDGNNQRIFNTSLELPYLFKSPIGLKGQINIFKQDSTFQNTKTGIELSYFIKYNTRIYLGHESTTSSDIQNSNTTTLSDFQNNFITATFSYTKRDNENSINPNKASTSLKLGYGRRESTSSQTNNNTAIQNYIELTTNYTFYLSQKNHIYLKGVFQDLNSKKYNLNELYRFGGIKSIRGFQENSLLAKTFFVLATEYRYLINKNFYVNTVTDYAFFSIPKNSETNDYNTNTISAGLGFSLQTPTGLLRFSAVNNYSKDVKTNFYNTIIHFSYNVKF